MKTLLLISLAIFSSQSFSEVISCKETQAQIDISAEWSSETPNQMTGKALQENIEATLVEEETSEEEIVFKGQENNKNEHWVLKLLLSGNSPVVEMEKISEDDPFIWILSCDFK